MVMLNVLEGFDLKASGAGSASNVHIIAEVMRRAFAARAEYLGDPDFIPAMPLTLLLSKEYANQIRATINATRASRSSPTSFAWAAESLETTHLSVVDEMRNAVALTFTLESGYGSKIVEGAPTGAHQDVVLSPDGGRIALAIRTPDYGSDISVYDLGRQSLTPITAEGGMTSSPLWTPNGKQLIFSSSRNNALRNLFRRAADGTGDIERLTTSPNQQSPWGWSKDGQTLVFLQLNSDTSYDILDGPISALGQSRALMQTKEVELYPTVSPDGDLMAYWSGGQIWVSPYPMVSESRLQVSTTGGAGQPKWSRDGRHSSTGYSQA